MPKSAEDLDPHSDATIHAPFNGINEALLKGYVSSIEAEDTKIAEIMRKAREACQPHIDEIKAIKKKAAQNKIPKEPLSAKLRERRLSRKAEGCREILNEDQQAIFDEITAKLGDLPLFEHMEDAA